MFESALGLPKLYGCGGKYNRGSYTRIQTEPI